ncbi:MAG: hypothetical protein KC416_09495 [Myxococcales bacterium]|nr:hypothetical protein [Myxococcales bacterium]
MPWVRLVLSLSLVGLGAHWLLVLRGDTVSPAPTPISQEPAAPPVPRRRPPPRAPEGPVRLGPGSTQETRPIEEIRAVDAPPSTKKRANRRRGRRPTRGRTGRKSRRRTSQDSPKRIR